MAQLVGLGLVGLLLWYGYRAFKTQMNSIDEELRRRKDASDERDIGKLEKGEDGVYRVKKKDDSKSA